MPTGVLIWSPLLFKLLGTAELPQASPAMDDHTDEARVAAGRHTADNTHRVKLTRREGEVLTLYLEHLNDKKVARQLGTKLQTVRNQLASIEHKFAVKSREELVAFVLRNQVLGQEPSIHS